MSSSSEEYASGFEEDEQQWIFDVLSSGSGVGQPLKTAFEKTCNCKSIHGNALLCHDLLQTFLRTALPHFCPMCVHDDHCHHNPRAMPCQQSVLMLGLVYQYTVENSKRYVYQQSSRSVAAYSSTNLHLSRTNRTMPFCGDMVAALPGCCHDKRQNASFRRCFVGLFDR